MAATLEENVAFGAPLTVFVVGADAFFSAFSVRRSAIWSRFWSAFHPYFHRASSQLVSWERVATSACFRPCPAAASRSSARLWVLAKASNEAVTCWSPTAPRTPGRDWAGPHNTFFLASANTWWAV